MINLRPLKVTLIDFDISYLRVAMTSGGNKGTPGYYPLRPNLKDGSTAWDAWAVAAIILESDMAPGEYMSVSTERFAQQKAEEHTKENETSPTLRVLLSLTMLRTEIHTMEGLHFMRKMLHNVQFRKY